MTGHAGSPRDDPVAMTMAVKVPGQPEPTRCCVHVFAARGSRPPVAVVSEVADNLGVSIRAAFPFVRRHVRLVLLPGGPEPLWVEHLPQAALAAVLLEQPGPTTNTLVSRPGGRWTRTPLLPDALERLLQDQ